jgi:hypothetical protein
MGLPTPLNAARFYVTEFATRYFEYPWVVGLVGVFGTKQGRDFRLFLSPNFTSAAKEVEDFLFGSCSQTFDERVQVARAAASLLRLGAPAPLAFRQSGMCLIVPVQVHDEFTKEVATKFTATGTVDGVREFRIATAEDRAYQTRFCSEATVPTWRQDAQIVGLCETACERACNANVQFEAEESTSEVEAGSDAGHAEDAPAWPAPKQSCLHTCREGWDDATAQWGGACREKYLALYGCLSVARHSCADSEDPFFAGSCSAERSALNACQR